MELKLFVIAMALLMTRARPSNTRSLKSPRARNAGLAELEGFMSAANHSWAVHTQLTSILNYEHDLPEEYLRKALVYRVWLGSF
jgi:hypothetical protein